MCRSELLGITDEEYDHLPEFARVKLQQVVFAMEDFDTVNTLDVVEAEIEQVEDSSVEEGVLVEESPVSTVLPWQLALKRKFEGGIYRATPV
jgi:hypothetical protein